MNDNTNTSTTIDNHRIGQAIERCGELMRTLGYAVRDQANSHYNAADLLYSIAEDAGCVADLRRLIEQGEQEQARDRVRKMRALRLRVVIPTEGTTWSWGTVRKLVAQAGGTWTRAKDGLRVVEVPNTPRGRSALMRALSDADGCVSAGVTAYITKRTDSDASPWVFNVRLTGIGNAHDLLTKMGEHADFFVVKMAEYTGQHDDAKRVRKGATV